MLHLDAYGFVKGQGCHVYHLFFANKNHPRSSCRRSNCWFDHPTESRALSLDRASHSGRSRGRTLRLCHYGYYCGLVESVRKKMKIKIMGLTQKVRIKSKLWLVSRCTRISTWFCCCACVSSINLCVMLDAFDIRLWPFIPVDGMVFTFPI